MNFSLINSKALNIVFITITTMEINSFQIALIVFTLAVLYAWRHAIIAAEVLEISQSTGFGSMSGADQVETDRKLKQVIAGVNRFSQAIKPVLMQHGLESAVVDQIKAAGITAINNRRIALEAVPSIETVQAIDRAAHQAALNETAHVMEAYGIGVVTDDILTRHAGMPSCRSGCNCKSQSETVSESSSVQSPSSSSSSDI